MNQQPGGPKSPEQLEYERLLAEFQTKKLQLERKAQVTRRQILAAMKECQEQIDLYQGRVKRMDEMLLKLDTAPQSYLRELTRERLLASRTVYASGLRMSEIQMYDYKTNADRMEGPNALDMTVSDSTGSYEYRLMKARSSFASAKLTLLDYKKPLEILEHVITTDADLLDDTVAPIVEEAPANIAPEAPVLEPESGEEQVDLDDAIRALLGDAGESLPVVTAVVPKAVPKDAPKAWERMSIEELRALKDYVEANLPVKSELTVAFPYYHDAVKLFEEADGSMEQLGKTSNSVLLKQLTQDGDNLLGKISGKVFYLTRLPELMAPYADVATLLPEPDPMQEESKRPGRTATAPLPGTNAINVPEETTP